MEKIVIIGGGFAGVNLAKNLAGDDQLRVILVDRNNYHFFPPLLYQVATGFIEPSNICYPFRKLFQHNSNVSFRLGEFISIDVLEKKITLSTGTIYYDKAVFAGGAQTNYFGMPNIEKNAYPLKNVNDAIEFRNYFINILEMASITQNEMERRKMLTIVIAGAGPTGIEIAGMLADLKRYVLPKDYPEIVPCSSEIRICLVDSAPVVLMPMSTFSQESTTKDLKKMGVDIKLNYQISDYDNDVVSFTNGEAIETKTLIWAAGITCQILDGIPDSCYGKGKRLLVDAFGQVCGIENVYAVGDCCLYRTDNSFPNGHPQLAQVAIQQGRTLAQNLSRLNRKRRLSPFSYHDKGTMAIIGRNKAVVDIPKPKLHFRGLIAWLIWIFIHLMSLISYRNRIKTLYNWVGRYLDMNGALRLMIRSQKRYR